MLFPIVDISTPRPQPSPVPDQLQPEADAIDNATLFRIGRENRVGVKV